MAANTKIEWATHSHNEWTGCTKVGPGCKHCYAEALGKRTGRHPRGYVAGAPRLLTSEANRRKPFAWDRAAAVSGERPRVFTNSLADVFDREVPEQWRINLLARMFLTPHLDWLVLTKRSDFMLEQLTHPSMAGFVQAAAFEIAHDRPKVRTREAIADWFLAHVMTWPLPNVRVGVSIEDQAHAAERLPRLLTLAAAGWQTMVSAEPLLGLVDLKPFLWAPGPGVSKLLHETRQQAGLASLGWVIVGGESGPGARPCEVAWIRLVVAQCKAAGIACFVKQLGANVIDREWFDPPAGSRRLPSAVSNGPWSIKLRSSKGGDMEEWPAALRVRHFPREAVHS